MAMVKKSISITEQQDRWLKARVDKGSYGSESEVFQELILERQLWERDTPEEISAIRAALIEGERSGISERSVEEIWEEAGSRSKSKQQA